MQKNKVEPEGRKYDNCIIEAIKCHHNDIANYLIDKENQKKMKYLLYYLNYDNYELISINPDFYSKCNLEIEHILTIMKNYSEFSNLLFKESYFDINYEYKSETLFSYAFKNHDIKLIKSLLSISNINPNCKIRDGKTALIISIEKDDMELINLLLACPNINPNASYVKSTFTNGKFSQDKITALTTAIEKGKSGSTFSIAVVNAVIKKINPNLFLTEYKNDRTLLSEAIENNDIKLVNTLLSCPNIDPDVRHKNENNGDEFTALSKAVEKENKEIINILLSNEKIITNSILYKKNEQKTVLLIAIEKGNDEIIQLLLQNEKIDPNLIFHDKNYQERTVLSMAVENENIKLTKMLLSCPSIDIYTKLNRTVNYQGEKRYENTILNLALYKNNKDIINLFFEHKRQCFSKKV